MPSDTVVFHIEGREVGSAAVAYPYPYELECEVNGVPAKFWYSGDTDERMRAIYTNKQDKVDFT